MGMYLKDPQALVDYSIDWAGAFLGGATIASSEWNVTPIEEGGIIVSATTFEGGRCVTRLGGGVAGRVYRVRNRVLLSDGRSDERGLMLRVEER